MNNLNLIANIISIVSGVITILGIGGIVSWSVFGKNRGPFQEQVSAVFAFSLKTAFCLFLCVPIGFFAMLVYITIVGFTHGIEGRTFFWDTNAPRWYLVGYTFVALLFVPLYLVLCSCIYEWSFHPFGRLRKAFRKQTT